MFGISEFPNMALIFPFLFFFGLLITRKLLGVKFLLWAMFTFFSIIGNITSMVGIDGIDME